MLSLTFLLDFCKGLLGGFLSVASSLPGTESQSKPPRTQEMPSAQTNNSQSVSKGGLKHERAKNQDDLSGSKFSQQSFSDQNLENGSNSEIFVSFGEVLRPRTDSQENILSPAEKHSEIVKVKNQMPDRPATPSMRDSMKHQINEKKKKHTYDTNKFEEIPMVGNSRSPKVNSTIEVKPLPKIRLDLMPAPREEDERDEDSLASPQTSKGKVQSRRRDRNVSTRQSRSRM